jgi:predicted short-subunit dehydrogenase-like oxidoreductase (DUF2520 family)
VDVAVIGAGRVGTAVGVLLLRAGHRIVAVSGRTSTRERVARHLPGVDVVDLPAAAAAGELVILGVPDDHIASVAGEVASAGAVRSGQWFAHFSGATPLAALDALRERGGRRLSIHPLQTVPDVESAIERIPGSTVAVTADDEEGGALGEALARDLGGRPFRLADDDRATYHAAAVFASNDLVALSDLAHRLLGQAGVPDPGAALEPLQLATVRNVRRLGAGRALTGPAVRGDAGTIERHLRRLSTVAPEAVAPYVAMCRVQLDLATASSRLSPERRRAVEEVLEGWI